MFGQCMVEGATLRGVDALPVSVEVVVSAGLPGFSVVGMADAAVQEARERVRAALRASGFSMPAEKIVVNLAPASLRKTGSGFDLPIAVGLLAATGQVNPQIAAGSLFVGELSLEGRVRPVAGTLAYALCARQQGRSFVCAEGSDAVEVEGLEQHALHSLGRLRTGEFSPVRPRAFAPHPGGPDFRDVAGHEVAKRALQIAAAGSHGVLLMGPPGSGKTMLASRLPSLLPPLDRDEALETALIHSVVGEPVAPLLAGERPFRKPHHSASLAGLVGGGSPLRPGEISLAHHGVLFLDEIAEFKSSVLQGIRQPLEAGEVRLTRADGNARFPARFMLVAASNPCPCGFCGDPEHECTCTLPQIRTYQSRIGGPLMDRIDLHLDVQRLTASEVLSSGGGTDSTTLREGVLRAREFSSWRRSRGDGEVRADAPSPAGVVASCRMSDSDQRFFEGTAAAHGMSGRAIIRTLGVARTIADMEESESVGMDHICEALGFRIREGVGS